MTLLIKHKEMIELLEQGEPIGKIANLYDISRQTVYQLHKRSYPGKVYSQKKWEQFIKLYKTNLFSTIEIAYFLRMRKESVQRFIRRYKKQ